MDNQWPIRVTEWILREGKRNRGRQKTRWSRVGNVTRFRVGECAPQATLYLDKSAINGDLLYREKKMYTFPANTTLFHCTPTWLQVYQHCINRNIHGSINPQCENDHSVQKLFLNKLLYAFLAKEVNLTKAVSSVLLPVQNIT